MLVELVEVVPETVPEPEVASAPEIEQGPEGGPEAEPRRRTGRSRGGRGRGGPDQARSSAWARFLAGRDPNPVEPPAVIMLGVRPHEPAREFAGNPACVICGGTRTELPDGYYCAGCEKMCSADEAQIRMARHATPSPSLEKKVPDHPRGKPTATGKRRKRGKPSPVAPGELRGGLG